MLIKLGRKRSSDMASVLRGACLYLQLFAAVGILVLGPARTANADAARGAFPRACSGSVCAGAGGPNRWITYGDASLARSGNTMTVKQTGDKAILNWETFDIGAGNTVQFVQDNSSSVALNRVWDPTHNPTVINGGLTANGQVYIINRNGILFGKNSRVDVNTLVASTLDVTDEVFKLGIPAAINSNNPAFAGNKNGFVVLDANGQIVKFAPGADGKPGLFRVDDAGAAVFDSNGQMIPDAEGRYVPDSGGVSLAVAVSVESGAQLHAQSRGKMMLFGPHVSNAGDIVTPDGQTILAAGNKIYLQTDNGLRGFLIEIDTEAVSEDQLTAALRGEQALDAGHVANSGSISAPRGNITLAGLALNQDGRLSASSAVNANGTIRLIARDTPTFGNINDTDKLGPYKNWGKRTGSVTFGSGSRTEIRIDADTANDTAVDEQARQVSILEVMGRRIELLSDADIFVPSGEVYLTATANPSDLLRETSSNALDYEQAKIAGNDDVGVTLAAGSRIDVSGVNVDAAMERNVVAVELRGNELKDSPLQRDGVLHGEIVYVDVRKVGANGQIPIADVSNAVNAVGRTQAERSTTGGTVAINSAGTVDIQQGSAVDVSGGAVHYQDGYIKTTMLTSNGKAYDISSADPGLKYDSILGTYKEFDTKWGQTQKWHMFGGSDARGHFEQGYTDGKDAGTLLIEGFGVSFAGDVRGAVQSGRYQRDHLPQGGQMILGAQQWRDASGRLQRGASYHVTDVLLSSSALPELKPEALQLDFSALNSAGMTRTNVYSQGDITLTGGTALEIEPYGALVLDSIGGSILDHTDIHIPSGSVSLSGAQIKIDDGVTISTAGKWTNDQLPLVNGTAGAEPTSPVPLNGGNISLQLKHGGLLELGDQVTLDADGGAWLQETGSLKAGKGGDIFLGAASGQIDYSVHLGADLNLHSASIKQGGTLELQLPGVVIDGNDDPASIAQQQAQWSQGQTRAALASGNTPALITEVLNAYVNGTDTIDTSGNIWDARYPRIAHKATIVTVLDAVKSKLRNDGSQSLADQSALVSDALAQILEPVNLPSALFNQGGFSAYKIGATLGDLTVAQNAVIAPQAQNMVLADDYRTRDNADALASLGHLETLPEHLRKPVNITLGITTAQTTRDAAAPLAQLEVAEGAVIRTDPGASVVLSSTGALHVDGAILAPAGTINLGVNLPSGAAFNVNRVLELGEHARLEATGQEVLVPDARGLRRGDVLNGGQIRLSVVGGDVVTDAGSVMDVSGAQSAIDLIDAGNNVVRTTVSSQAGVISIDASENFDINGQFVAQGGGGALTFSLDPSPIDTNTRNTGGLGYRNDNLTDWQLHLQQQRDPATESPLNTLSVAQLTDSGASHLKIKTTGQVVFDGNIDLHTSGSLSIDAPVLRTLDPAVATNVTLDAPYLSLGASRGNPGFFEPSAQTLAATPGLGEFHVGNGQAQLIDLNDLTVMQGFSSTSMSSGGDIRLRGSNLNASSFASAGDVLLKADQVYPTTMASFTLATGPATREGSSVPGSITVQPNDGHAPAPVYSAGGSVTLDAAIIEQDGVLKAPLGEITLGASVDGVLKAQTVTLGTGSITSTAADVPVMPFGQTAADATWGWGNNDKTNLYSDGLGAKLPDQRVSLQGESVTVATGAVLDMHGGGDLIGYEFLPGPGGSKDVLSADVARQEKTYAIIPSMRDGYAPYDLDLYNGWDSLQPGASINLLDGTADLKAGVYPLLPARYALLPGAYLVTELNGYRDLGAGQNIRLADGTAVAAGRATVLNTDEMSARTAGFALRPGSYARQRSEYAESHLSNFLLEHTELDGIATPRLLRDAGTLTLNVTKEVNLQGRVRGEPATDGRGALVDVAADHLAVVQQHDAAIDGVQILAGDLNNFGAQSILLGGTRTSGADGTVVNVKAQDVTVKTGVDLVAPEVILVAGNPTATAAAVTIEKGATVAGRGEYSGVADNLVFGRNAQYDTGGNLLATAVKGDGALIRVASANQVRVIRHNTGGDVGDINVVAGASLSADRSMTIDAGHSSQVDGSIDIAGGSLNLGAEVVNLGSAPVAASGLKLDAQRLSQLQLDELVLTSRQAIAVHADTDFGLDKNGATLINNIVLNAPGIENHAADGTARISANNITLENTGTLPAAGSSSTSAQSSTLLLNAQATANTDATLSGKVNLGPGTFSIAGFDTVTMAADLEVVGTGRGTVVVDGALTIETPLVTVASGADTRIDAGSHAAQFIAPAATPAVTTSADSLGGKLEVTAANIEVNTRIEAPAGAIHLAATGTSGDVSLGAGATLDVSGATLVMAGVENHAPGGRVELASMHGDIAIGAGASVDLSGDMRGGDAGQLRLTAPEGGVIVNGEISAHAEENYSSGKIGLDVATLENFSGLNTTLNDGGFQGERAIRVRSGDIVIGADDVVKAQEIALTADAGSIDVAGMLDASGAQGGQVELNARGTITLESSAAINASSTGSGHRGGSVVLGTAAGSLDLSHASLAGKGIDVAGHGADGGTLDLRAPRVDKNSDGNDDDVAVTGSLQTRVNGARGVTLEAYKTITEETINPLDAADKVNVWKTQAGTFMTGHETELLQRLDSDGRYNLSITPGLEVRSAGDLTVNAPWDFSTWRFGSKNAAGVLRLRAAHDVKLGTGSSAGSLSDAFNGATATSRFVGGESWSYHIVAGADVNSADPMAVIPATDDGDVVLAPNTLVRTGVGQIDIAAGRDVVLRDPTSVVYTAGTPAVFAIDGTPLVNQALSVNAGLLGKPKNDEKNWNLNWTKEGGAIAIEATRDIVAPAPSQFVVNWLWRQGNQDVAARAVETRWAVDFGRFQQGIGALGGGDIALSAGRDMVNVSASIPTTGYQNSIGSDHSDISRFGGGNLRVDAGRDVLGGIYYVGNGDGVMRAGGSVSAVDAEAARPLYPVLVLGQARFDIAAGNDVNLGDVVNPTVIPRTNFSIGTGFTSKKILDSYFFETSADAGLTISSLGGDVRLTTTGEALRAAYDPGNFVDWNAAAYFNFLPPSLSVSALQGSVGIVGRSTALLPAASGQLRLMAAEDVNLASVLTMSDADPSRVPAAATPEKSFSNAVSNVISETHAAALVHAEDLEPVVIVARDGDIRTGGPIRLPKAATIVAGNDIRDLQLITQNLRDSDITLVQAGRDLRYPVRGASSSDRIEIDGPGRADIVVGRNLDLGGASGITTEGNLHNRALAEQGANLNILVGVAVNPNYGGFITRYLGSGGEYSDTLRDYVRNITGDNALSSEAAPQAFLALSPQQQRPFVLQVFFNELRAAGRDAASGGGSYQRGYDAVATLFPDARGFKGDLSLYLSRVYTLAGGDINILIPGGQANAGLAVQPQDLGLTAKGPSELGIVAQGDGHVYSYSRDSFIVNQSRVFTLHGGDILMWSNVGDIDAGRGAKSAVSAPQPTITFDAQGNAITTFSGAINGSGIRAIITDPAVAAGDVDLFAPKGKVDAGDAGIGGKNVTIGANQVVGAANIDVGGIATGVPVADTGGLAAGLTGVSNLASSASKAAENSVASSTDSAAPSATPLADSALSFLEVEVIGYGDESEDAQKTEAGQ